MRHDKIQQQQIFQPTFLFLSKNKNGANGHPCGTDTCPSVYKRSGRLHFRGTPPACWPKAQSESDPCTDGLYNRGLNPLPPEIQSGAVFKPLRSNTYVACHFSLSTATAKVDIIFHTSKRIDRFLTKKRK